MVNAFAIGRGMILEQLDFVSVAFEDGEGNLGPGHAGDFGGEIAGMMGPMGKLEPKNIAPESKRLFQVRDGDAGVIDRADVSHG